MLFSCKGHLVSLLGLPSNPFTSVYPVPYLLGASSTPPVPRVSVSAYATIVKVFHTCRPSPPSLQPVRYPTITLGHPKNLLLWAVNV